MKKLKLLIAVILLSTSIIYAQNVGVNNPNPQEALDVDGNINLTGEFKANGESGQNGQVLQANGNGEMEWVGTGEYSNFIVFKNSTTWNVPSGVTDLTVELWGGGAGGAEGGGGGAGSYVKASRSAFGVSSVSITIGNGSFGSTSTSDNGSNTVVVVRSGTATAYGGRGASSQTPGAPSNTGVASSSWYNVLGLQGPAGNPTQTDYAEQSAGFFVTIAKGGNGGDSIRYPNSGGRGGTSVVNGSTTYKRSYPSAGYGPGAGGGGGVPNTSARRGADGLVIIYWN